MELRFWSHQKKPATSPLSEPGVAASFYPLLVFWVKSPSLFTDANLKRPHKNQYDTLMEVWGLHTATAEREGERRGRKERKERTLPPFTTKLHFACTRK